MYTTVWASATSCLALQLIMEEKEEEYLKSESCKENKSVYKKCEDTHGVQKKTKDVLAELLSNW